MLFSKRIVLMINPIFPKNPIGKIAVSLPRNQMISLVTGLFSYTEKTGTISKFHDEPDIEYNLCFRLV